MLIKPGRFFSPVAFPTQQLSLSNRFSLLITLAVILATASVGIYFDYVLQNNFLQSTEKRMKEGFIRFADNLKQFEEQLKDGMLFAIENESLIASIELINNYQDKQNYNTFLIDEEKKSIANTLLNQVRLTVKNDIYLYDINEELQVFVNQLNGEYLLNYITYTDGIRQIKQLIEPNLEYTLAEMPHSLPEGITAVHQDYYNPKVLFKKTILTYHQMNNAFSIKAHQMIFDTHSKKPIAHIEMTKILDGAFFKNLSKELGLTIHFSFNDSSPSTPLILSTNNPHILIQDDDQHYTSSMRISSVDGDILIQAKLDKAPLINTLHQNRLHLIYLLTFIAAFILMLMRYLIHRSISSPLNILMEQIHRIGQQDYTKYELIKTGDELQTISSSVQKLADIIHQREYSLEESARQMEHLSNHDSLTGLPNRRFFSTLLENAIQEASQQKAMLALFYMDMDDFKLVNDTLGHDVGDELLRQVTTRLSGILQKNQLLARIGGDEFNLLVHEPENDEEVTQIAENIRAAFTRPFHCFHHQISVTMSIGIALYPQDGFESLSLSKHSDLAMYEAKSQGRNNYSFYTNILSKNINHRASLYSQLREAIKSFSQFELFYQPKISSVTEIPVSAEVLIRWKPEDSPYISPLEFIKIAEDTGLIIPLGEWIIQQALSDLQTLNTMGLKLDHLSINVSAAQLGSNDCVNLLAQLIKEKQLDANQVELEITESYLAKDQVSALNMLNRFRELGMRMAIDDFGTGYSSLGALKAFPLTRLKIDKTFIDGIPNSPDSNNLAKSIISLAKNLGLAVTAEGVEHRDQFEWLKERECDEIQGYLFAKPMPFNEFMDFLKPRLHLSDLHNIRYIDKAKHP